jgi:hypothetical protein
LIEWHRQQILNLSYQLTAASINCVCGGGGGGGGGLLISHIACCRAGDAVIVADPRIAYCCCKSGVTMQRHFQDSEWPDFLELVNKDLHVLTRYISQNIPAARVPEEVAEQLKRRMKLLQCEWLQWRTTPSNTDEMQCVRAPLDAA